MTPFLDCAVADRARWLVAGVETACAVLHHQAAAASKTQRRNSIERYRRCSIAPKCLRRRASRVTLTVGANLKSP